MTFHGWRAAATVLPLMVGVLIYIAYAGGGSAPPGADLASWARLLLISAGLLVAGLVLVMVVLHVTYAVVLTAREPTQDGGWVNRMIASAGVTDERDRGLARRGVAVGYTCATVGLLAALAVLAAGSPAVVGLHVSVGSFVLGLVASELTIPLGHEGGLRRGQEIPHHQQHPPAQVLRRRDDPA